LKVDLEAPFTREIALAALHLPMPGDPADRFLAATAQVIKTLANR